MPEPASSEAVLLHGDLSPDHVLFDRSHQRQSGVIDFSDLTIGDPAWDLLYLYADYGVDFVRRLLRAGALPASPSVLERVFRFYVLDIAEWVIGCATTRSPELPEALSELRALRAGRHDRLAELLTAGHLA